MSRSTDYFSAGSIGRPPVQRLDIVVGVAGQWIGPVRAVWLSSAGLAFQRRSGVPAQVWRSSAGLAFQRRSGVPAQVWLNSKPKVPGGSRGHSASGHSLRVRYGSRADRVHCLRGATAHQGGQPNRQYKPFFSANTNRSRYVDICREGFSLPLELLHACYSF